MHDVEYPALFAAADAASVSGQRWYARLVELDLGLILVAALAGGLSSIGPNNWRQLCAVAAAITVGTAAILRWVNRAMRRDKTWFDGRTVAESVKTASWRYMMRVDRFAGDDRTAEKDFVDELKDILKARSDLTLDVPKSVESQITPGMQSVRALEFPARKSFYIENRVQNQVGWYSDRAALHRRRATTWFLVGIGAEVIAVVLAVIRAVKPGTVNLIGFLTSLAAGATAFGQLQRNDELTRSYALAAQELLLIKSLLSGCDDAGDFEELVKSSEGAISREHTMWIAKRS
jgi:hypothetical protein